MANSVPVKDGPRTKYCKDNFGLGPKFAVINWSGTDVENWSHVINFGPGSNLVQDRKWLAKFGPGPKLAC